MNTNDLINAMNVMNATRTSLLTSQLAMQASNSNLKRRADDPGGHGKPPTKPKNHSHTKVADVVAAALIAVVMVMAGTQYVKTSAYDASVSALQTAQRQASEHTRHDDTTKALADKDLLSKTGLAKDELDQALTATVETVDSDNDWKALDAATAHNRQAAATIDDLYKEYWRDVRDEAVSRGRRRSLTSKSALANALSEADDLVSSTEGKVHDDTLRTNVTTIRDDVADVPLYDLTGSSVYDSAYDRLYDAMSALQADNASWQAEEDARIEAEREAAEEAARQAAAQAAQAQAQVSTTHASPQASGAAAGPSASGRTGSVPASSGSSANGTWNVNYRGTDNDRSANADGSVSRWRDGYYIAHSWSAGGKEIASKPGHVVVDGKSYHYVSSMTSRNGADADPALAFARQNGGIGFQTCTGGGNVVINHYEPD